MQLHSIKFRPTELEPSIRATQRLQGQWRGSALKDGDAMYSRDNKIMRKLLGKVTADNITDSSSGLGITSAPNIPASYRPSASQNAVYAAGVPILSVDASPDRRRAVLGGRHILKIVDFDGLTVSEGVDLRAAITSQPVPKSSGSGAASIADQLSIKDVKWHGTSTIFTACANGKIFSYDLNRVGSLGSTLEFCQTREDSRQVNTLDVNPHRGTFLLSGSQDGIVRCFDVRISYPSRLGYPTYKPVQYFKCNADGVRHVQWSTKDGFYFACATEAGVVLKWDIRKASTPALRINAHEKACSAIAWHPDGEHLISGGWDNTCKVWDMSKTADKRQKAKWTISTPAPVAALAWRPGLWSATAQSRRAAQVAVSYDDSSHKRFGINSVHIWDLARPTMPFKEIERFDSSPTAMMWHDQDNLWTVGQDGLFNQCDVAFAPKVIDRQSLSSMAFSSRGDVLMFLDERPHSHRPRPSVAHQAELVPRTSYGSNPTTPMLSISRSDSEEDVVGSFLGPRRRLSRKRRPSTRSNTGMSTTPPSTVGFSDDHILTLEQALKVTGIYKSHQAMAIGHVPSAAKVNIYQYLSSHYLETLERELPYVSGGKPMVERVASIMEHYARAAENVSLFRLAQTWRILGYAANLLLKRRAQFHLEIRLGRYKKPAASMKQKEALKAKQLQAAAGTLDDADEDTPRKPVAPAQTTVDSKSLHVRSLLSEEIESTSNVATPLARPVSDEHIEQREYVPGKKLTPVLEADSFTLPPPVHGSFGISPRRRLDSEPISIMSHDSEATQASIEGYDFYDTESLSRAIDVPGSRKQEPLLDFMEPRTPNSRRVLRQDSDESFGNMFSISDGSRRTTELTPSLSSGSPHLTRRIERIAEHDEEGSDIADREYDSRVRGKAIEESPEHPKLRFPHRSQERRPQPDSPEDLFLLSQTTMGTDTTVTSVPSYPSQPHSDTPLLDVQPVTERKVVSRPPSPMKAMPSSPIVDTSPTIIEIDYLPWPGDPRYPYPVTSDASNPSPSPLNPYTLITRALDFETRSSALNASAIILLLKPLVPAGLINNHLATAILRQHHSRLVGMRLFVEAALLRNLCVKGWPEGLPDWGENYTTIFSPAQQSVKAGFMCSSCRKPREVDPTKGDNAIWTCERCKAVMAPCAVCGHKELTAAPEEASGGAGAGRIATEAMLNTWWICPGCGHGGHSTCLQQWHGPLDIPSPSPSSFSQTPNKSFDYSEGCCPLDGCGHACIPGKWMAESRAARSEEVGRAAVEKARNGGGGAKTSDAAGSGGDGGTGGRRASAAGDGLNSAASEGRVQGDPNDVLQSRAVANVRETLAGSTPGILSSSPGRAGGERERRKSVKFVSS
jgi:WD repeat-containing protein 24